MPFRSKSSKTDLLRGVGLFAHCTDKELGRIAALADEVEVADGATLTREGQPGHEFFVIVEGRATVARGGDTLATIEAGSFFGEMSLLDQGPRAATVTANGPTRLLVLDSRSFHALLHDVPSIATKILIELVGRLRRAEASTTH
jgi:CRP/FNR family transcriptional regulator, cyclic AMP receptor protein